MGLGACAPEAPITPRPNVLMIVVEGLRADRLGQDPSCAPVLDALAAQALSFDDAYATAPWAGASVASIFTGQLPVQHGVTALDHSLALAADTLAERLSAAGYDCRAVISDFTLGSGRGLDQGFHVFALQPAGPGDSSSDEVTRRSIDELRGCAAGDSPFFLLANYSDPNPDFLRHDETDFGAEASTLSGGESLAFLQVMTEDMQPGEVRALSDLYDGEVRHTDAAIGRLLDELERLALARDTLVVVTSSHGVELFDRGWIGSAHGLHDELVRVPLMLRLPARWPAGRRHTPAVSLASLAPALLEVLGLAGDSGDPAARMGSPGRTGPWGADAVWMEADHDPRYGAPGRAAHRRAVVANGFKLIRDQQTGELELFDLTADPAERIDLALERPAILAELRAALELRYGPPPES